MAAISLRWQRAHISRSHAGTLSEPAGLLLTARLKPSEERDHRSPKMGP